MRVIPASMVVSAILLSMFALGTGCPRKVEPVVDPSPSASVIVTTPIDAGVAEASSKEDSTPDTHDSAGTTAERPFRREEWEVAIGKWTFAENGEVWCECKTTSSLLYWKGARPKDFDASVEVYFPTVEASAGIVFRLRGEDFYEDATFFQFEWYTRGSHHDKRLSLMKKNPYWVQIVTPTFPEAPLEKWIKLRVRAVGDRLETWVNGEPVFAKADATFMRSGKIGLHVFQPRKVGMRDFRLTVLDAPSK